MLKLCCWICEKTLLTLMLWAARSGLSSAKVSWVRGRGDDIGEVDLIEGADLIDPRAWKNKFCVTRQSISSLSSLTLTTPPSMSDIALNDYGRGSGAQQRS